MIDIHCHILYGIDDSITSKEEMKKMLAMAVADGITHIAATPHMHYKYPNTEESITPKFIDALSCIEEMKLPLQLIKAGEVYLSHEFEDVIKNHRFLTYGDGPYILIEFPWKESDGEPVEDIVEDLIKQGYIPVIAHPERYKIVKNNYDILYHWKNMGCLLQVNRTSILGFDKIMEAKEIAWRMMDDDLVDAIASDSHGLVGNRQPILSDVRAVVVERYGEIRANTYFEDIPRRILNLQSS